MTEATYTKGNSWSTRGGDGPRVCHAILAYRKQVDIEVAIAMVREATWARSQGWTYEVSYVDCCDIALARNTAALRAHRHGCDLLLFQDTDTFLFPEKDGSATNSAIAALYPALVEHDAAIVGAAYAGRSKHNVIVATPADGADARPGSVFEAEWVGTGLMLIDLRKLRELPQPWFVMGMHARVDDGGGVVAAGMGEDVYFCRLARRHGHRVLVAHTLSVAHRDDCFMRTTTP